MTTILHTLRCLFVSLAMFLGATGAYADEADPPEQLPATVVQEYIQVWLGSTDADEAWSLDDSDGNELVGDYDNLPLGGGVGQRLWGRRGQYGYEGGGLVSWRNEDIDYAGTSPGLLIAIEGELFMLEAFMGGVIAVQPTQWLRLYAAAGPSIAYGYLSGDDEDDEDDDDSSTIIISGPNSFVVIDGDDNSSDFSFSAYARAGIEFEFNNGVTLGASVRYADHEFDFDSRGKLELDEVQWLLTIGGKI